MPEPGNQYNLTQVAIIAGLLILDLTRRVTDIIFFFALKYKEINARQKTRR